MLTICSSTTLPYWTVLSMTITPASTARTGPFASRIFTGMPFEMSW